MSDILFKLVPLLGIGWLCVENVSLLNDAVAVITSTQQEITAEIEMVNIARAVRMHMISYERLPLDDFPRFLQEAMTQEGGRSTRDRSRDMWGTPYRLERREEGFAILCAGPDRQWGTKDDIEGVHRLSDLDRAADSRDPPPSGHRDRPGG